MKFVFFLVIFCFGFLSEPAKSEEAKQSMGPQQVVEAIFSKASSDQIGRDLKAQSEINEMVDFAVLARSALGRQAKSLSASEVQWFQKILQEIIAKTVYPRAPEFLKGVVITYESTQLKGKVAQVKSSVQNKADLTDVHYKLAQQKDGSWRVVDVSIAGLSWVDSIGDQVRETIKQKKWKGLKEAMEKRLAELNKSGTLGGSSQ